MTNGFVKIQRLFVVSSAAALVVMACSSQPNVQVPTPSAGPVYPGADGGGEISGGGGLQSGTATMSFPDINNALAQYAGSNASLNYNLTLGTQPTDSGHINLVNGQGDIKSRGYPVGTSGKLSVDLYDATTNKLVLHGENPNVVLKAGLNTIPLTVTDASGNNVGGTTSGSTAGSSTADLDIQINAGGTGTGGVAGGATAGATGTVTGGATAGATGGTTAGATGGTTAGATSGTQTVTYAVIAPLSAANCNSCHQVGGLAPTPDLTTQNGWTAGCKLGIASDVQSGRMPQKATLDADTKSKMINYCNSQP